MFSPRSDTPAMPAVHVATLGHILRAKARSMRNRVVQQASESPVKLATTVTLLTVIWFGLYFLFWAIFQYFQNTWTEAAVTIPLVFSFFFAALLVMLTISNAIIAYVSLFSADEASFLLTAPLPPRRYVSLKYLETLLFSSWSLVLLGLPLMLAMATYTREPWYYYPMFVAFFLAFVPIPGAVGMLLAWIVARCLTRHMRRRLAWFAGGIAVVVALTVISSLRANAQQNDAWLRELLLRLDFVQLALFPSGWVTRGVEAAMQFQHTKALAYLAVTLANGLFLSEVAIRIVARRFLSAFDRAISSRGTDVRRASDPSGGVVGRLFFYLPTRMRLIAAKDMRTFLRDPLQWTQLVILFGLMGLYLLNLPRLTGGRPLEGWGILIPFLNFGAVSFILATFTSRFVFPLVSLEGPQFWLIGLLPLGMMRLILAKFCFAMTVSITVAVGTTLLAATMMRLSVVWTVLQIILTLSVCVGLCGLAVGLGARMPLFREKNAARIANGLGGTINLIASVALVLIVLLGVGYAGFHDRHMLVRGLIQTRTAAWYLSIASFTAACGVAAMLIGARHLNRREM